MKRVFADTLYWVAITHRKDQWHQAAVAASRALGECHLVTTDDVLSEVLTAFSETRPLLRRRAATLVRKLHRKPTVTVFPQSRGIFPAGLSLYEARPDKGYSLTDCVSMHSMRQEGIRDVLTHGDHFRQEGFTVLL